MATSTSVKLQTSQGSAAMPASAQTNDDATLGRKKIRNFCLGENGQWKLGSEMLSHSEFEKYTKKIIWDESVSLKEDEAFARHLLESLEEDLGYRNKFTSQKKGEGYEKTKKVELQTMFPHEAERWETLRDRMVSLPHFDRYRQKNPDWSVDELFSSCLMDRFEEQLNNSDDSQNYNNTTLEKDTSRDSATVENAQKEEKDVSEDVNEDVANTGVEDGDARDDDNDLIDFDDDDDDDDFGDEDEDKNDEDWLVDDEDGDSEDDDDDDDEDSEDDDGDSDDTDTDVDLVCNDPEDSDDEPLDHKPPHRRKTRQDSRLVIQHKQVSSSDRDKTEEETTIEDETAMKAVTESKEGIYECKFCKKVFRTRFLVTKHYTTKHQSHVYSYVARLKQHRLEKHQVCQEGGRNNDSMDKLQRHTKSHTNPESKLVRQKEKVYECKICDQLATSFAEQKCDICCKYFSSLQNLANHKQTHSNDKTFCVSFVDS